MADRSLMYREQAWHTSSWYPRSSASTRTNVGDRVASHPRQPWVGAGQRVSHREHNSQRVGSPRRARSGAPPQHGHVARFQCEKETSLLTCAAALRRMPLPTREAARRAKRRPSSREPRSPASQAFSSGWATEFPLRNESNSRAEAMPHISNAVATLAKLASRSPAARMTSFGSNATRAFSIFACARLTLVGPSRKRPSSPCTCTKGARSSA